VSKGTNKKVKDRLFLKPLFCPDYPVCGLFHYAGFIKALYKVFFLFQ